MSPIMKLDVEILRRLRELRYEQEATRKRRITEAMARAPLLALFRPIMATPPPWMAYTRPIKSLRSSRSLSNLTPP